MKVSNPAMQHVKTVSKTAESISDRLRNRKDVDELKFPFQKTTNVRLLPMMPTTAIIPTMNNPAISMLVQTVLAPISTTRHSLYTTANCSEEFQDKRA